MTPKRIAPKRGKAKNGKNLPEIDWPDASKVHWPEMPPWVPSLVREQALLFWYERAERDQPSSRVLRLARSPVLEHAWRELFKRRRNSSGEYLNSYCNKTYDLANDASATNYLRAFLNFRGLQQELDWVSKTRINDRDHVQQLAAWRLYRTACSLDNPQKPVLLTKAQIRSRAAPFLKLAPHLREAAALLEKIDRLKAQREVLTKLAQTFEETATLKWHWNVYYASNDRGDPKTRVTVMALNRECQFLFGRSMLGTIASIVSELLDKRLTVDQVKSIINSEIDPADI